MNDERKQQMREIMAEEARKLGLPTIAKGILNGVYSCPNSVSQGDVVEFACKSIDRIAALQPEPPKEVDLTQPLGVRLKSIGMLSAEGLHFTLADDGTFTIGPGADPLKGRAERVEEVKKIILASKLFIAKIDTKITEDTTLGAILVIDALAGKISASNNEAEVWKGKYKQEVEHSRILQKIIDVRLSPPPAEGPDQLDRIVKMLKKIPRNERCTDAHIRLYGDGSWSVRYFDGKMLCNHEGGSNLEQAIAEYVAGLDKPSDLQCELDGLGDDYFHSRNCGSWQRRN